MTEFKKARTSKNVAKLCIWTIRNHNFLITRFRLYMWSAVALVLFLSIANVIHLKIALLTILFSALCIVVIFWALIERRKTCLLKIRDPDLRQQAHAAMLELIYTKRLGIKKEKPFRTWLRRTLDV